MHHTDAIHRCLEHGAHLAAKAFIQAIFPSTKKKKSTTADPDDSDGEEYDSDVNDDKDGWGTGETSEGTEADDSVEFDIGDVLSKLLGLINQVR
jgi:hypothetical protein